MSTPSFSAALAELGAGSLESQATAALTAIAQAITDSDQAKAKGALRIDLRFERARGSGQLLVTHTMQYTRPTATGKLSETSTDDTLVYVGRHGRLSVIPETQGKFDFSSPIKDPQQ